MAADPSTTVLRERNVGYSAFDTGSNRWRYAWLWSAIWLVYLAQPFQEAWQLHDPVKRVVGVVTIATFAIMYISMFQLIRNRRQAGTPLPYPTRTLWTVASIALTTIAFLTIGQPASGLLVYLAVMAIFFYPNRIAIAAVLGILAASIVIPALVAGWSVDSNLTFSIFVAALAMWGVTQILQRNAQLAAAREELARLAVAEERNRLARDLHDILGHSLTVIAIKAELAGRLIRLDPGRAEAEVSDVEQLSRQALADVRAAVAGFREVTLAGELAGARSALTAAEIKADLPTAVDPLPPGRDELFGWAVREGVTNVIRHSGASACRIRVSPDEVEVCDDGQGPGDAGGDEPATVGHGLVGLRERAHAAGGSLHVGRGAEGGFSLRVRMP
jgi:two-component system sensor histidine kinase DesK